MGEETGHPAPEVIRHATPVTGGRRAALRRAGRFAAWLLVAAGLAVALTAVVVEWRTRTYDGRIQRLPDAMPHEPALRPVQDAGRNWLLIGSDLRGVPTEEKWRPGRANADAIMLLHLPETGRRAYVVSIPRDLWVDIPGHPRAKIQETLSKGGPRLLAETVEALRDGERPVPGR